MQQVTGYDRLLQLLDHPHFIPVAGMIVGVVAILAAALVAILVPKLWFSHRQRMAMIARGMHPDAIVDDPLPPEGEPPHGTA
jgi:hypothetical protein